MRQLTFGGFTKRYVQQVSLAGTTAVYVLTREASTKNLRLREPLFLYAISNQCLNTLLTASRKTDLYENYRQLADTFSYAELLEALATKSSVLSERYHKVWDSFQSELAQSERDARVKKLIATRVRTLQKTTGISTYRLCKELGINNSNVNTWLKNDDVRQISLNNARRILDYLSNA